MNEAKRMHDDLLNTLLPIVPRTVYQDIRRLNNLAWAVTGHCLTHTVRLSSWAEVLESRANLAASRVRRFSRWLHHPAISPPQWYLPILQVALVDWSLDRRLYIALDTTALTPFVLIRASLVYRGRALSLAWRALRHKGTEVSFEDYQPVLGSAYVLWCHRSRTITLLADSGFVHERLFHSLQKQQWHFRLRLKGTTLVHLEAGLTSPVKELCPPAGDFLCEWAYEVYDQQTHPALGQSPHEAWESGLDLAGQREHRRIHYDDVFRILTLPGSPRETALVSRNRGIQFHYLLYWNDVLASPSVVGTKVPLRYDPFDISHVYAFVHNHWIECITPSYYGQLHGHSEREVALASAELHAQNQNSHVRTPIDAGRLAEFLAKIEAHEAVLLQRQRDIENQVVAYHMEQNQPQTREVPRPVPKGSLQESEAAQRLPSRFAPVDLTTLQAYSEYR